MLEKVNETLLFVNPSLKNAHATCEVVNVVRVVSGDFSAIELTSKKEIVLIKI